MNSIKRRILSIAVVVLLLSGIIGIANPDTAFADEDTCQHQWGSWSYVNGEGPTCGSSAEAERYCELCGERDTIIDPATEDHDWSSWEITEKPTALREGERVRECWECEETEIEAVPKLKAFAKFKKQTYSVTAGKTLSLKGKVKMARGDKVKAWKIRGNAAKITTAGKVIAKKAGIVKVTVTLKSGKKATCKVKIKGAKKKTSRGGGIVYWVPNGYVYHLTRNCPTLSRSRTIYSGTRAQSGKSRCCKVCG